MTSSDPELQQLITPTTLVLRNPWRGFPLYRMEVDSLPAKRARRKEERQREQRKALPDKYMTKAAFIPLIVVTAVTLTGCMTPTRVYPGGHLDASDYSRMQQAADKLRVYDSRAIWQKDDKHRPMPDYVYVVEDGADFRQYDAVQIRIAPSNDAGQAKFDQQMLRLVRERLLEENIFRQVTIEDAPASALCADGVLTANKNGVTFQKLLIGGHYYLQYEFRVNEGDKKVASLQVTSSNAGAKMAFGLVNLMAGSLESRTANLLYRALKEMSEGKKTNAVWTNKMPPAVPEA